ncbi:MAG: hypothetical protein KGQ51_19125 [Planctomycetes bacterium]|nr:hypothetical protein [Planctomycetota bacterium]
MAIIDGLGSLRRMHEDFTDVVELINVRKLDKSFVRFLHKSVQDMFRSLVDCAQAED